MIITANIFIDFFNWLNEIFSALFNFISQIANGLLMLFKSIPSAILLLTNIFNGLPSVVVPFAVAGLSLAIVYLIVGRNHDD